MKIVAYEPRYRDSLLEFIGRVFPEYPHKSEPAYFDWMFGGHPLGSSLGTYQLLVESDRVVGQIGTMRDRLRIGGDWYPCLWIVDLVIDPAFRGGLAARQLFKRAMSCAPVVMATGVASHVVPIYNGLGWRRLTFTRARYSVLRPTGLLALAGTTEGAPPIAEPVRRVVLPIADRVLPLLNRAGAAAWGVAHGTLQVEAVPRFLESWDEDIAALTEQCGVTQYRSAAVLNWKFVTRPVGQHRLLVLRTRTRGLRGMIVLKWMSRASVARWLDVADYLVAPSDPAGFRSLARAAVAAAAETRVDFVRFRLSHPAHVPLLRSPIWLDHTRPFNDDVFVFAADRQLLDSLQSASWHLTALASDRNETGRDEWRADVGQAAGRARLGGPAA